MWGNASMFDLPRKTLISMSPMRLGPQQMGILAAQLHQPLSGTHVGCYAGFNHGRSRQVLEQRAL